MKSNLQNLSLISFKWVMFSNIITTMKQKKRKPLTVLREILELMALNDPFGVAIDSGMTRKMLRIVAIFR